MFPPGKLSVLVVTVAVAAAAAVGGRVVVDVCVFVWNLQLRVLFLFRMSGTV